MTRALIERALEAMEEDDMQPCDRTLIGDLVAALKRRDALVLKLSLKSPNPYRVGSEGPKIGYA